MAHRSAIAREFCDIIVAQAGWRGLADLCRRAGVHQTDFHHMKNGRRELPLSSVAALLEEVGAALMIAHPDKPRPKYETDGRIAKWP